MTTKPFLCLFGLILVFGHADGQKLMPSQIPSRIKTVEPFRITPGSSFSATGSGAAKNSRAASPRSYASRALVLSQLQEAEDLIRSNYAGSSKVGFDKLTKTALVTMLHGLDPHSNFFDPTEWKQMMDEERSGYTGIGVSLAEYVVSGVPETYIVGSFPGSSAAQSSLRFGDKIVAVNDVATSGLTIDSVRDRIRGAENTKISLMVERADGRPVQTVELRRGRVPQPSISDAFMVRPGVGYIDLSDGFNYTTNDELDAALRDLHNDGVTSLILDLRGNGGGIVDQAVKVAEKFLPTGTLLLSQHGRTGSDYREWRSSNSKPETMPLVVLVDENTASASEIVAGALQDNDRALIVGERTFGKGLVQNVIDLPGNTGLTLTAARYNTPSGRSIQRDYSDIGRYDYYNQKGKAALIDKPYFEARTVTNRKIFGGSGIAPDKAIHSEEMNKRQVGLLNTIFFFVREAVGRNQGSINAGGGPQIGETSDESSLYRGFIEFVNRSGHAKVSDKDRSFIVLRARYEFATAIRGVAAGQRVLTQADVPVATAINSLAEAGILSRTSAAINKRRGH